MRKNQLIEMLQAIKGNPEVVLWNGLVEDWHHAAPPEVLPLFKRTAAEVRSRIEFEAQRDKREISEDRIQAVIKSQEWEFASDYMGDESEYRTKKVVVLAGKLRGKEMHDRLGAVSY